MRGTRTRTMARATEAVFAFLMSANSPTLMDGAATSAVPFSSRGLLITFFRCPPGVTDINPSLEYENTKV